MVNAPILRTKWRWLLGASAAYVAVLVVLLLLEDTLLYRPKHNTQWLTPPPNLAAEDVWLTAAGVRVHAWWCPCPGADGAVLFCHGNSGNISQRSGDTILKLMHALQESVLIFDYPGYGQSDGVPSESGCYAAADAAYDWLSARVAAARIDIMGQSLGGGVATDLASRRPHRALVLAKTFASFPEVAQSQLPMFPARWLVRNRFDNLAKIGACTGPVFIAHGDRDHLIPLSQAQRLFEAAPVPKRFLLMRGHGHHGGLSAELFAELAEFLPRLATRER